MKTALVIKHGVPHGTQGTIKSIKFQQGWEQDVSNYIGARIICTDCGIVILEAEGIDAGLTDSYESLEEVEIVLDDKLIERVIVSQFKHGNQGEITVVDEFLAEIEYITADYPVMSGCISGEVKERTFPVVRYNGKRYCPQKSKYHGPPNDTQYEAWGISLHSDVQLPQPLWKVAHGTCHEGFEREKALKQLEAALTAATNTGLFDRMQGDCDAPDQINNFCDLVDRYKNDGVLTKLNRAVVKDLKPSMSNILGDEDELLGTMCAAAKLLVKHNNWTGENLKGQIDLAVTEALDEPA